MASFGSWLPVVVKQRFLAVEVAMEHAIDGAGAPVDALHARAAEWLNTDGS
jgi:hypothetical protein